MALQDGMQLATSGNRLDCPRRIADFICSIIEFDGDIWMATPNGISQYDTSAMSITNYDTSDGLLVLPLGLVGATTTTRQFWSYKHSEQFVYLT